MKLIWADGKELAIPPTADVTGCDAATGKKPKYVQLTRGDLEYLTGNSKDVDPSAIASWKRIHKLMAALSDY